MFTDIRRKYPELYATQKHKVGQFTGFQIHADIDKTVNCKQKERSRFMPKTALQDMEKYFSSDVFQFLDGGEDRFFVMWWEIAHQYI